MGTIIENLLSRKNDKFTFHFAKRQTSIILTAMSLIRFENIAKAEYWEAKDTVEQMREIIVLLEGKLKEKERYRSESKEYYQLLKLGRHQ